MKRTCIDCNIAIEECMGSVIAGDFLLLIKNQTSTVRELCGKCTLARIEKPLLQQYPKSLQNCE